MTGHWKVLVPILILPSVANYIGTLFTQTHQIVLTIVGVLISIVAAIFSVAMLPSLVNAVHRLSTESGAAISLKEQYKFGFKYFWSIILVGIIFGFAQIGSFVLFVIPMIVLWVYSCLYLFALVVDDKRGFSALTESYSLVRGRWWPVFGRLLFLVLVVLIIWFIFIGIGFLIGAASGVQLSSFIRSAGQAAPQFSFGFFIVSTILNLIGTSIIAPIGLGYTYRMYTSLKSVRNPNIQTGAFKKWIIAFICVGAVAIVLAIIIPLFTITKMTVIN